MKWDEGSLPITYCSELGQWPLQDTVPVTCCGSMRFKTGASAFSDLHSPRISKRQLRHIYLLVYQNCSWVAVIFQLQDVCYVFMDMLWYMSWGYTSLVASGSVTGLSGWCLSWSMVHDYRSSYGTLHRHLLSVSALKEKYTHHGMDLWQSDMEPYPSPQMMSN